MKVGFWGLLQLIFITLKLTNYINWSWWLVLLPSLFWVGCVVFIFVLALVIDYAKTYINNKR